MLGLLYYAFATLFAQLAITLRLVTIPGCLIPTAYQAPRVYAVTGKNRWIAFWLCFMSFVQVGYAMAGTIHFASRPGMISLQSL